MKALTLTQPRATLVAIDAQRIVTCSWATEYRGPLLIHAAAGLGPVGGIRGFTELLGQTEFTRALDPHYGYDYTLPAFGLLDCLPFGAIVARCELVDCVPSEKIMAAFGAYGPEDQTGGRVLWPLTDQELAFGNYAPGRYAWLLADVEPMATPIPAKGALGLWNWEGSLP